MDAKAIVQHPAELKPPPRPRLVKLLPSNIGGPLIGLVLLVLVFSFSSEVFLSLRKGLNILDQVTVLGILAIGMTAVIVIGGIDLSVGSVLAFSMMMLGWLYQDQAVPLGFAEALRQVELAMLKSPGRSHPFYWASFIQSGEWADLDGKR